jgi:hypothetical protein
MSDGPHKSLNMRRGWKKLAERAANHVFEPAEISNAVIPALVQDWRVETPAKLIRGITNVLEGQQTSLFTDQKLSQLEGLRPLAAGHSLGQVFLDCAIEVARNGGAGSDASVEAATNALAIRASCGARQVEEHYCRKSTTPHAQNVRGRIEEGIASASLDGLARQLLNLSPGSTLPTLAKQQGLDDGVRL